MKNGRVEKIKQLFGDLAECLNESSGKLKSTHTVERSIILGKLAELCVCTRFHTKHAIDARKKWEDEMDDPDPKQALPSRKNCSTMSVLERRPT